MRLLATLLICVVCSTSALAGPGDAERSRLIGEAFRKGDAKTRARAKLADLIRGSALTKAEQRGRLEQLLEVLCKVRNGEGGKPFELVKFPSRDIKSLIVGVIKAREFRELAPLSDQSKWNSASDSDQDLAISNVKRKLVGAYTFVETKRYLSGGISFRIAIFQHKRSGLLLNLVPGGTYRRGHGKEYTAYKPVMTVTIPPMLVGQT